MTIKRPDQSEFAPFYAGYIGKVPDSGPGAVDEGSDRRSSRNSARCPRTKANHAYASRQVDGEGS